MDLHRIDADLDLTFHFDANLNPDLTPKFYIVSENLEKISNFIHSTVKFIFIISFIVGL